MGGFGNQNGDVSVSAGAAGPNPVRDTRMALLTATLITIALSFLPYGEVILYPLRLFVTFIHESGHAMATILTGGSVVSLAVHTDGSGLTQSLENPAWAWLILSGGYLGTALFGAVLLQVARIQRWHNAGRVALYTMALYILTVTLLWGHNPVTTGWTLVFGLAISATLFAIARFTSPRGADFAASFLAVQCSLNALTDLRNLFLYTHYNLGDNDALFMSQHYVLPPTFWAILWAIMAVVILGASLWSYLRSMSPRRTKAAAATVLQN